jgi:DNA-binding MarR family transcriptional regulator
VLARSVLRHGGAGGPDVDNVLFALKRAYHGSLRVGRKALVTVRCDGLTPARLDMLYALERDDFLPQRELQRILGVTKATVSRMVRALEELGYVKRDRDEEDRRCMFVWLTERGTECLYRVKEALIASGKIARTIVRALGRPVWLYHRTPRELPEPKRRRVVLRWLLRSLRTGFHGRGCLRYPRPASLARLRAFWTVSDAAW